MIRGKYGIKRCSSPNAAWVGAEEAKRGSPSVTWFGAKGSEARFPECGVSISAPRNNTYEKRPSYGGRFRLSKNSGELERGAALSNFQSCPAACTAGTGRFLQIPFSREKSVSLQFLRPKIFWILAKTGEGGRKAENSLGFQVSPLAKLPTAQIKDLRRGTWPGSLLPRPPACQNFFDKLIVT